MIILYKKYNKFILVGIFIFFIVLFALFNLFSIKFKIEEAGKINNFSIDQEEILIDKSEDIASLGYSGQRKIVKDRIGNFYIAYRKKYNGYYEIFVAKLVKGNNEKWLVFGTDKPIAFIKSDQRVPSIAIDSNDIVHVVWYGSDSEDSPGNRQIKYSKSNDGGNTWDHWKNISPVLGYSGENYWQEHPDIFVGPKNEVYIVWEGKDAKNDHQQVKFSKSTDNGQSWQAWINISVSPNNSQSRPTIIQDSTGKLHVFMYSSFGGRIHQIWYSYSEDQGNSWSAWKNVSNSSFDSRHISASIDGKDNLHVVWRAKYDNESPVQIYYSVLDNSGWSKPVIVARSKYNQFFPNVTVDKNGIPYVIWMETEKDYGFPKEWPERGKIYISYFLSRKGEFSKAKQVNLYDEGLYPGFLLQMDSFEKLPFVYSKIKSCF